MGQGSAASKCCDTRTGRARLDRTAAQGRCDDVAVQPSGVSLHNLTAPRTFVTFVTFGLASSPFRVFPSGNGMTIKALGRILALPLLASLAGCNMVVLQPSGD